MISYDLKKSEHLKGRSSPTTATAQDVRNASQAQLGGEVAAAQHAYDQLNKQT